MHYERDNRLIEGVSFKPLFSSEAAQEEFYDGYCNAVGPQMRMHVIAGANSALESMFKIVD